LKLERQIFESNTLDDIVDKTKKNIIIIGGSINGLYMSILLKLFMPNLNVIIVTNKTHSEFLKRTQPIRNSINRASTSTFNSLKRDEIDFLQTVNKEFDNPTNFKLFLKSQQKFSLIPDVIKDCFSFFGIPEDADDVPINIIEYCFANYTQTLGNYILFREDGQPIDEYITDKTIMLFDATGGRLEGITYTWTNETNEYEHDSYHRKDYNESPISYFGEIPCLAIGDSLYQGNWAEGNSVVISFCVCFTLSLVLSKSLSPPKSSLEEESEELDPTTATGSAASTEEAASAAASAAAAATASTQEAAGGRKSQRKTKRRKYKIKRRNRSKTRAKKY